MGGNFLGSIFHWAGNAKTVKGVISTTFLVVFYQSYLSLYIKVDQNKQLQSVSYCQKFRDKRGFPNLANNRTSQFIFPKYLIDYQNVKIRLQACNLIKKEALALVLSCEFFEISKNTFFHRTPGGCFCLYLVLYYFLINCVPRCCYFS